MNERIKTGIKGLDTILGGGFLRYNSILLKGAPGTGKTSVGIQILLQGIEENEGGIICSFEQFPQQLYRDAQSFGWDLKKLVDDKKLFAFFIRPEDLVTPEGAPHAPLLTRLAMLAEERGAKRLLVDSITHFNRVTADVTQCRALLLKFVNEVKSAGLTPILTAELLHSESREFSFEEYLVDELVLLRNDPGEPRGAMPQRTIEIAKGRGHAHARGRHPFAFGENGIEVYPHILPKAFAAREMSEAALVPVTSGVAGIDHMLGGGYLSGTATIIAGMSGTYKTTLAGAFLAEAGPLNEKGLLITFEEMPQHLLKILAQRGVNLAAAVESGRVVIRHYVPGEDSLDKIFSDLQIELEAGGLKRVVIDSFNDFERCIDGSEDVKSYLGMFLAALRRAEASMLITQKLERVSNTNPIADIQCASMVDSVIYLGNVEIESQLRKVISVLKTRGANAAGDLREIRCDGKGLHVAEKFHGLSGILQGTAQGQYKQTIENIFQPLQFIRDFAQMGSDKKLTDVQCRQILAQMIQPVGLLDTALREHFGINPDEAKKR